MDRYPHKIIIINLNIFLISLIANILYLCPLAFAQSDEEMQVLQMFFREEDLAITPTRTSKPVSRVPENISIINSGDIEEMNAHTLTDVLNTVPGVQMDIRGGPGSEASPYIQGAEFKYVLVMLDGVRLNNLSDNFADISSIPVQNIERVEIIKGPASSSWGSSLGGIINVITKKPEETVKINGTVSASNGKRNTGDYRAEISGTANNIGYYMYGGNLASEGLRPNTNLYENNFYSKLKWDVNRKTDIIFTFGYNKGSRGRGEDPEPDRSFSTDFEYLLSTLSLDYSINAAANLRVSLKTSRQNVEQFMDLLSTGEELSKSTYDDRGNGGSAELALRHDIHNIVIGTDYDNGELDSNSIKDGWQRLEKWAFFFNDTIVLFDNLTIIPGIRYDYTNTNGDFLSPSLGITLKPSKETLFRAYATRGFSTPPLSSTFGTNTSFSVPNPDLEMEKVWSYQAGMESTALKYLKLKTTLFRHDIKDAITREFLSNGTSFTAVNKLKQRRQGIEAEIRTVPIYDTTFFAGFVFIDAEDRDSGKRLSNIPGYTCDVGIQYNDNRSFIASVKGHYIWWNAESSLNGKYDSPVWDIDLSKKFKKKQSQFIELFLTAHNIFNGSQYLWGSFKNPQRWGEGGIKLFF